MPIALFGKWSLTAAGITLVGLTGAWIMGGPSMFNPGELHAGDSTPTRLGGVTSHAALATKCQACHAAPWSSSNMGARCLDCHTDIQAERRDTTALHGRVALVETCRSCHTEHHGPDGELTRLDEAGAAHAAYGFALSAHEETAKGNRFACADCHDETTWRFERARCASCHREYQADFVAKHEGEWGSDCMSCHDGRDRFSRGVFDHARLTFQLTGAHARATCVSCHANTRTLADFKTAASDCAGCHRADDTHRGDFGPDCAACHATDTWKGARFQHDFPLDHGGHGRIECRTCHEDRATWKTYTCYGCHEHSPARIRAKHDDERIDQLDDCVRCHPTGREHEREDRGRRRERERHS